MTFAPSPPTAPTGLVRPPRPDRYKWTALINTTAGVALATIDITIIVVAMPNIFRGIHLNPLAPSNSFFLLWMMLGYAIVGSVLLVSFGRLGDQRGRVKVFNLGFAIYTAASLLLAIDPLTGPPGAWWLLAFRFVQGLGGACIVANSGAILTDAFPIEQRGFALGLNMIAATAGTFIGLIIGGVLAPIEWRLVFFVSVPFGIFGTCWAYMRLEERGERIDVPTDWAGNLTFAGGLVLILVAVTFGIEPAGGHQLGWLSPRVLGCLGGGIALMVAFVRIERVVEFPMFQLSLFRIRAFAFGGIATFFAALARGGLQFVIVVWLQGIWLPLHGVSFARTPMWAGISMLPITAGLVLVAPLAGRLSDRYGSRQFAATGLWLSCVIFVLIGLLPSDFRYPLFACLLFLSGAASGLFLSPNRSSVMGSLPPGQRGVGSGMNSTFLNAGQIFSQGVFFTLMILGLSTSLPHALAGGLVAHGVPPLTAQHISHVAPVAVLFAAFLGYNPLATLIGPRALAHLPPPAVHELTSRAFFPHLIAAPFHSGLRAVFAFSAGACLLGGTAAWIGGSVRRSPPTAIETPIPDDAPAIASDGAALAVDARERVWLGDDAERG